MIIFSNVLEIHVLCIGDMRDWHGASEEVHWPCDLSNVYLIDPLDGETMRVDQVDRILETMLEDSYQARGETGYGYPCGKLIRRDKWHYREQA